MWYTVCKSTITNMETTHNFEVIRTSFLYTTWHKKLGSCDNKFQPAFSIHLQTHQSYGNTMRVQKKPNFLNSAPTSTEGTLRLLSAPSGRIWQVLFVGTACARAQFSWCSSTTNAHSETGQMALCSQNLPLGALSSRSAPAVLVGALF